MRRAALVVSLVALGALGTAACGGGDDGSTAATISTTVVEAAASGQQFPDVIDAVAAADGVVWSFDVTISSPYDTPQRYADAWRVVGPDGTVFGVRELAHDHAAEQPFTRSLAGVEIPTDVDSVTIEGRDSDNGWGGATLVISLDAGAAGS